ncbi:EAL domain-containing protein [Sulfuricystis multivorans]|uniref:EAL domain-containing protein n=1 Tax=Sulfuricystis multivorans TaxID=2211108 RepID=UPI000F8319E9|nr:EAL domain-containing protein [Sulfuricystis multivorans]
MEAAAPIRVLYVEDDPFDRELVLDVLEHAETPFALTTVGDRREFETALQTGSFDCVLTDYEILGYSGLEVFDAVQAVQPNLPVVILTGTGSEELAVAAMKRGAADYIIKTPEHIRRLPLSLNRVVEQAACALRLKQQQAEVDLAAKIFAASSDGLIITDAARKILAVNPAFCALSGYRADELIGRETDVLNAGPKDDALVAAIWGSVARQGIWQGEIRPRRKDGTRGRAWLTLSAITDPEGAVSHYVIQLVDLTERKQFEEHLRYVLQHDALTDLPNLGLLTDHLEQALSDAARQGRSVALMTLNLTRFRAVNEHYGRSVGDRALIEVARRLSDLIRASDTVARSGADEFDIVLTNLDEEDDAILLAQRILDRIAEPLDIDGHRLALDACIGIALYPKDAQDVEGLFKSADSALDHARKAGKHGFHFFDRQMNAEAQLRLRLEADLREAVAQEALEIRYQPQVDLHSGRICGYEALLRWQHPQLGAISPTQFVPLAEEIGLIDRIGTWVLRQACQQNKIWLDAGAPLLPVAVNVSPHQFRQEDLAEIVSRTLSESGLPGAGLELEITESSMIEHPTQVADVIGRVKALGVKLALDDFGTGYSSLSYLSSLPFDKIKIDQSFIRDVITNPVNAAIVSATIAMGRSLGMTVLAEGVENEAQLMFLRSRRCEAMQGWLFSKDIAADQLGMLLKEGATLKVGTAETAAEETLLLLDDEPNILNALRRLLRREGYRILATTSPQEAFALLAQHRVQVIVSDQRMPEMSGTEFLSRVRQIYPDTVRIVLSGYTDLQSITDAINRGAIYRFLVKPWDDEELRQQIREAFRVAHGLKHG